MDDFRKNVFYRFAGPVLFGLALIVYILTLSSGPFPGVSAYQIAQVSGVEPRLTPGGTLMFWTGRLLAIMGPASSMSFRLNIFSALCGALSAWLMFQIVSLFVIASIDINPVNHKNALFSAVVAGIVSAVSMMFSSSFWIVSTRFYDASFNVLIFLGMIRFFMAYLSTRSQKRLLTFAFFYGVCVVEYPPFIPFAMLFGPFILFWLWAFEELDWKIITRLILAVLLGLTFYFIAAWSFYGTLIYGLMEDMSYFRVIWEIWKDQYYFLSAIIPRSGWLIVIAFAVVPWLCGLFLARRGLNEDPNWSLWILHMVLTVCAVAVLVGVDFITKPLQEAYRILVMPYVLTSAVVGYLAAYWYRLPLAINEDAGSRFLMFMRRRLGSMLLLPFAVLILVLPFINFRLSNGRVAGFANRYCDMIIEGMSDCRWLISDGNLDYNLMIRARETGRDLHVINVRRAFNITYMRYISQITGNETTQNYIEIGIIPMLTAWLRADKSLYRSVVVFTQPDLWRALGYNILPHMLVFKGLDKEDEFDIANLVQMHNRFWDEDMQFIFKDPEEYGSLEFLHKNCLRHMGLMANNIGVMAEDAGKDEMTFELYARARAIDKDNVSALLNQSLMIDRGYITVQAEAIRNELEKVAEERGGHLGVWSLAHRYGYVRHPEAFARQGMTWAMSGRPDMAVDGLKRAEGLLAERGRRVVRGMMAQMYLSSGHTEEGEDIYRSILEQNPDDPRALIGMAEVSLRNGDVDTARTYIERAEKAGVPPHVRDTQWVSIAMSLGDMDRARVIVENALLHAPDDMGLLVRQALILDQQNDDRSLGICLDKIERRDGGRFTVAALRGDFALKRRDIKLAMSQFEKALTYQPGNPYVIEKLLRLNFITRNKQRVTEYARKLLNVGIDNAFAHYAIGTLRMGEKNYKLAEASFRKSIECNSSPEALNDLAHLLFVNEKYQEAESLARSATELNPEFYMAWDTLGEILMKTGRMEEAEQSFQKALSLVQTDMRVHLHLAEVFVARGRKKEAGQILEMLFGKMNQLPGESQSRVVELRSQIRN